MTENTTNTFSPLTNDIVRTPGGSLTIIAVNPTNGTATISGTNIIFTPTTNFLGTANIGYTIIDNVGGTNTGLITVLVTNIPPLANPDGYNCFREQHELICDFDERRCPHNWWRFEHHRGEPTNGTAIISGTNIIFTPTNNSPEPRPSATPSPTGSAEQIPPSSP